MEKTPIIIWDTTDLLWNGAPYPWGAEATPLAYISGGGPPDEQSGNILKRSLVVEVCGKKFKTESARDLHLYKRKFFVSDIKII